MSSSPDDDKRVPVVRLNVDEKDPRVVSAYQAACATEEAFNDTVTALCNLPIPGADRSAESLRRISIYLATLFGEILVGSLQLGVLDMPRAQHLLNRQLLEYLARNRWFVEHEIMAQEELDRLPKTVRDEVVANAGAFKKDPAYIPAIEAQYAAWAAKNPTLDSTPHKMPGITEIVRLYLDDPDDLFWYYGLPSIIVHGKTHGLQEVLKTQPGGGIERSMNSVHFDRVEEMYRATSFALEYGALLVINFSLNQAKLNEAAKTFAGIMIADGITPKAVPLKKYR